MTDIDIITINYRTPDLARRNIAAFRQHLSDCEARLTVIDVDPIVPLTEADDFNYLIVDNNCGYAKACNLGASMTDAPLIAFLNADARISDNQCLDRCVEFLNAHDEVAVVGPLQVDSTGRVTHGGIFGTFDKRIERGWRSRNAKSLMDDQPALYVSGSALFTKRAVWDEMAGCRIYQEVFPRATGAFLPTPHFWEDSGYCAHVKAHGYEVWYLGSAQMIHEWHKSSSVGSQGKKLAEAHQMFNEFCDAHGIATS